MGERIMASHQPWNETLPHPLCFRLYGGWPLTRFLGIPAITSCSHTMRFRTHHPAPALEKTRAGRSLLPSSCPSPLIQVIKECSEIAQSFTRRPPLRLTPKQWNGMLKTHRQESKPRGLHKQLSTLRELHHVNQQTT